jgi:hypothetical protein
MATNVDELIKKLWEEEKRQLDTMGDISQKYIWQAGYSMAVLKLKLLLKKVKE